MNQHFPVSASGGWISKRKTVVLGLLISVIMIAGMAFSNKQRSTHSFDAPPKDSIASVKAFKTVYAVLMSPRCMNCHPAGDIPLQGDDSHLHTMSPQRGVDGKGVYAMKCANCHQPANIAGLHTPPGNPNWHLPPGDMKMVFEGRSPRQLALQLVDQRRNGHKDLKALLLHASDTLVVSAWHPGEGRTLPPVSHETFKKAWTTWLMTGAYAPAK